MAKHSQWSDFDTTDDYRSMDTEPCKIIVRHTGAYILLHEIQIDNLKNLQKMLSSENNFSGIT